MQQGHQKVLSEHSRNSALLTSAVTSERTMHKSLHQETQLPAIRERHYHSFPHTKVIHDEEENAVLNCQVYNISNMKVKSCHPYYCMNQVTDNLKSNFAITLKCFLMSKLTEVPIKHKGNLVKKSSREFAFKFS